MNEQALSCDLLVIGSGAGGLSAAVTAAWHGLKVIVAEKEPVLGGTTAWSGGWMWAPLQPAGAARRHRRGPGGAAHLPAPRARQQFRCGPGRCVPRGGAAHGRLLRAEHGAAVRAGGNKIPDTYGNAPGAGTGGRSVIAAPYDARGLGDLVQRLRKPMRETTFLGMTIQAGPDLAAFMNVTRSPQAFAPCRAGASAGTWSTSPCTGAACSCATAAPWSGGCCARPPISASSCASRPRPCGCCRRTARCRGAVLETPDGRGGSARPARRRARRRRLPARSATRRAAPCFPPTSSI